MKTAIQRGWYFLAASPPVVLVAVFIGFPIAVTVTYTLGHLGGANSAISSIALHQVSSHGRLATFGAYSSVLTSHSFLEDLVATVWVTAASVGLVLVLAWLVALYGRLADKVGRKKIYGLEAGVMVVAALASALSPGVVFLIVCRFILGLGVGGDYPVSAVIMSEYSNRKDRGKLVGLVFAMQALGTVTGYAAGLALLSSGLASPDVWRILLALGAVPAAAVLYSRRKMPESPRYLAMTQGRSAEALAAVAEYSEGTLRPTSVRASAKMSLGEFFSNRRYMLTLLGTAGTWFVFDYAYYGNSVSSPLIVKQVLGAHSTIEQSLALNLIMFTVAALPGYYLAAHFMDRIGHRRLQLWQIEFYENSQRV